MKIHNKILKILGDNKGEYVSGEELANSCGVTRAYIWKVIKILREQGYKINAATNKGYSLEIFNDVLSVDEIKKNLSHNSKISRVICLDSVDSTNNYAKNLALNGATHGTLITSNEQTAGRGRRGHFFESPAGTGLYMSLILRPSVDISQFQMITIADAVAVCLAIEDLYKGSKGQLKIKWVNDIFFHEKKITGILTEAVTNFESGEIESVVTGIGINISTKNFSEQAGITAGSIFSDGEFLFSRSELCARIADYVMDFAENLSDKKLINAYRERSLLTGKKITFMKNNEEHSAFVEGIDDTGGLMIINEDGGKEILRSGEVFSVRS